MSNMTTQPSLPSLRDTLTGYVQQALESLFAVGFLSGDIPNITLAPPKIATHGDYACHVALALSKQAGMPPSAIAEKIQEALGLAGGLLQRVDVAGPGYLNLTVAQHTWHQLLVSILNTPGAFARSHVGQGKRVLVEFVSANPTGPLHVAHGRGAVIGDVVANLFAAAGYHVEREYYINDTGQQADVLARSIYIRYQELFDLQPTYPEAFYPGAYIHNIAQDIQQTYADKWLHQPESAWLDLFRDRGVALMLARIRDDLQAFGIHFDHFVSEKALATPERLQSVIQQIEAAGYVYSKDGKKWFQSTAFHDDKDRVLVRDDGRPTYFAADIAYHADKMQRGFDRLINVWGADHDGYVARIKAGLQTLQYNAERLHIIFIQMVSLCSNGDTVRMGKRLGTAVWLQDVVAQAGKDATRYLFLMRRADSQMEFDIDLACKKSIENPVYYAQMGHARLAGIARRANEEGHVQPVPHVALASDLVLPEEIDLIKMLARVPDLISDAAQAMEPHQVIHFLQHLIAQFHSYYSRYKHTDRVVSSDHQKTAARLLLCRALQKIIYELLTLLGIDAPEEMHLEA